MKSMTSCEAPRKGRKALFSIEKEKTEKKCLTAWRTFCFARSEVNTASPVIVLLQWDPLGLPGWVHPF